MLQCSPLSRVVSLSRFGVAQQGGVREFHALVWPRLVEVKDIHASKWPLEVRLRTLVL